MICTKLLASNFVCWLGQQYENLIRNPYYLSTVKVSKFNSYFYIIKIHPSFEIWHKIMKNDMYKAAGVEVCMLASAGFGLNKVKQRI